MASFKQFAVQSITIVAGIVLTAIPGTQTIGIGLLVSGGLGIAAGFITAHGGGGLESSPTYRPDGATNIRGEGERIPVVYGEVMMTPLAIHARHFSRGDEDEVEMVLLLGRGPMQVYKNRRFTFLGRRTDLRERITINDVPIAEVDKDADIVVRRDFDAGDTLPGFSKTSTPYPASADKLEDGESYTYQTHGEVDAVQIQLDWPSGLYHRDKNGGITENQAGLKFEVRKQGSTGEWILFDILRPMANAKANNGAQWPYGQGPWGKDTSLNPSQVQAGVAYIEKNNPSHLRVHAMLDFAGYDEYFEQEGYPPAYKPSGIDSGAWDIRITGVGTTDDSRNVRAPVPSAVFEISDQPLTNVDNLTVLGIKYKAGAALGDTAHTIKVRTLGRQIAQLEDWGETEWTDNAVSQIHDYMTNDEFGCGADSSKFDLTASGIWRSLAEEIETTTVTVKSEKGGETKTLKLGRCNVAIDTEADHREWVNRMLATFRGAIFEVQDQFVIKRDKTRSSSRTFESRPGQSGRYNIVAGRDGLPSHTLTQVPDTERYSHVSVRFIDADENFQQRTVTEQWESLDDEEEENHHEIFLPTINNEYAAIREARYILALSRIRWVARWQVAWGDIDITPLDHVTVNADWPQWSGDTKDWVALAIVYAGNGVGEIVARESVDTVHDEPSTAQRQKPYIIRTPLLYDSPAVNYRPSQGSDTGQYTTGGQPPKKSAYPDGKVGGLVARILGRNRT